MSETNERLRAALITATERVCGIRTWMPGSYTVDMVSTLADNPELARAWRDALVAEVPDPEPELDYPISDPADDAFRGKPAGQRAVIPEGLHPSTHYALTRPQVNALAEAAGLTGNWPKPMSSTWDTLDFRRYVTADHQITDRGREWLRAAGILPPL